MIAAPPPGAPAAVIPPSARSVSFHADLRVVAQQGADEKRPRTNEESVKLGGSSIYKVLKVDGSLIEIDGIAHP